MTKIFDPKITPGEWKKETSTKVFLVGGSMIAEVLSGIFGRDKDKSNSTECFIQSQENAKAIAAIPELLKLLRAAQDHAKHCDLVPQFMNCKVCDVVYEIDQKHGSEKEG